MPVETILLLLAFILFLCAAGNLPSRINLTAAGLACVVLAMLSPSIG